MQNQDQAEISLNITKLLLYNTVPWVINSEEQNFLFGLLVFVDNAIL